MPVSTNGSSMVVRHVVCAVVAALLVSAATGASAQAASQAAAHERIALSEAINVAGRQRMLTQRIVKAYCQIGLNVRADEARQQLADAVMLFERQLGQLRRSTPNTDVAAAIARVDDLWAPFRSAAQGQVSRAGALRLLDMDEDLLAATNKVVLLLQDAAGTSLGRLVNISGRQRMLSQRIAKYYLAKRWGFANAAINDGLQQVTNEFRGALDELKSSSLGNQEIRKGLDNAEVQWSLMEYSLKNEDKPLEEFVALTSEKILIVMDQVTDLYTHGR